MDFLRSGGHRPLYWQPPDGGNIDKWTLYQVAQYCDRCQTVKAATVPSHAIPVTCIQERNDAYTVLRDFAIFRGMTYWGGDQIVALADMPRDVDYSYTRANVVDGRFTYSAAPRKPAIPRWFPGQIRVMPTQTRWSLYLSRRLWRVPGQSARNDGHRLHQAVRGKPAGALGAAH
jgi:hypothetical protein